VSVFVGSNNETLTSFIESADFGIGEGNSLMFMDRVIPDYEMVNGGKIRMKITTQQYPESPTSQQIEKEFDITETTQKVDFRARGRQARVRVSCESNATSWRWGSLRLALQADGGR
jgi:hypothetical protein